MLDSRDIEHNHLLAPTWEEIVAIGELELRLELAERGGDLDFLAATPLEADQLLEDALAEDLTPEWNAWLHPRDQFGQFIQTARAQHPGPRNSISLTPRVRLRREKNGTWTVVKGQIGQHQTSTRGFTDPGDAARAAADISARSRAEGEIGGTTVYKGGFDAYLKARGIDPDQAPDLSPEKAQAELEAMRRREAEAHGTKVQPFIAERRANWERKVAAVEAPGPARQARDPQDETFKPMTFHGGDRWEQETFDGIRWQADRPREIEMNTAGVRRIEELQAELEKIGYEDKPGEYPTGDSGERITFLHGAIQDTKEWLNVAADRTGADDELKAGTREQVMAYLGAAYRGAEGNPEARKLIHDALQSFTAHGEGIDVRMTNHPLAQENLQHVATIEEANAILRAHNEEWLKNVKPGDRQEIGATTPLLPGDKLVGFMANGEIGTVPIVAVDRRMNMILYEGHLGSVGGVPNMSRPGGTWIRPGEARAGGVRRMTVEFGPGHEGVPIADALQPEVPEGIEGGNRETIELIHQKMRESLAEFEETAKREREAYRKKFAGRDLPAVAPGRYESVTVVPGPAGERVAEKFAGAEVAQHPDAVTEIGVFAREHTALGDAIEAVNHPSPPPQVELMNHEMVDLQAEQTKIKQSIERLKTVDIARRDQDRITALQAQYSVAMHREWDLQKKIRQAARAQRPLRAEAVADALSRIRPRYGEGSMNGTSRSPVMENAAWAMGMYPYEWIEGVPLPELHKVPAGGSYWGGIEHRLNADTDPGTMVHEFAHVMEEKVPGFAAACREFYRQRTEDSPLVSLKSQRIHMRGETRPDDFADPYIGREYGTGVDFEVASTAVERLFFGYGAGVKDGSKDHAQVDWMIGMLLTL